MIVFGRRFEPSYLPVNIISLSIVLLNNRWVKKLLKLSIFRNDSSSKILPRFSKCPEIALQESRDAYFTLIWKTVFFVAKLAYIALRNLASLEKPLSSNTLILASTCDFFPTTSHRSHWYHRSHWSHQSHWSRRSPPAFTL